MCASGPDWVNVSVRKTGGMDAGRGVGGVEWPHFGKYMTVSEGDGVVAVVDEEVTVVGVEDWDLNAGIFYLSPFDQRQYVFEV